MYNKMWKCTISWCNWRLEDRTLWPTTTGGWSAVGTCSDKRSYWYRSAKSQLFGIRNAFGKKEICMSTYYFLHYFDRHTGIKGIKQGDFFGYHKSCKYIYDIFFNVTQNLNYWPETWMRLESSEQCKQNSDYMTYKMTSSKCHNIHVYHINNNMWNEYPSP